MTALAEEALYEPCRRWLSKFLRELYPRLNTGVLPVTHKHRLRSALLAAQLDHEFPECSAWDVKVDVVGFVRRARLTELVFVELKAQPIRLVDVGQLLGYCRVCNPTRAFLLSPRGMSSDLKRLLTVYGRRDLLEFSRTSIQVGRWDIQQGEPDWGTLVPGGETGTVPEGT